MLAMQTQIDICLTHLKHRESQRLGNAYILSLRDRLSLQGFPVF